MSSFAKEFEEAIAAIPQQILADTIIKKLSAHGIKLSQKKAHLLAGKLLNGDPVSSETFIDRVRRTLGFAVKETVVAFTEDDVRAVEEALDAFVVSLPQTVQDTIENTSSDLLFALKKDWSREARRQMREREAFKRRLYQRWGEGLHLLKLLIAVCQEVGSEISSTERKTAEAPLSAAVLARLHARGCQISEEIVCLLEGGFSDGAMARWRTLHEISAVAALINEHGEELAERYLEHDAIECARAARQYQKYHTRLGAEAISDQEMQEFEERAQFLKEKYGKDFGSSNGWAANHLGIAKPNIDQLIAAARIDHMLPYYKIASHNIHANPRGIFFKLGIIGETEILLAGPSNAGLEDPGQNTAISLMQITSAFALMNPTLDDLISMKVIQQLAIQIGDLLVTAQQQLDRDEASSK
ncbi:DUF5677 domain-containing protein [Bradyrhizobium sp. CCBAU 25338]|uniref:DUF5677 domain-containing protein n=1 Tax=Bradyrhizobium sp. CCBAU 25338 TaxID=1641877 RepID=UPI0023045088|nr:DUF5677 domain-containing protein [Bradyrhizobium sp. CCBAU 25338]MDA9533155.1 hypothetical protein [Bradyrhizobium sp. CCBAU 25338]